jgi:hypothetical protein
MLTLLNLNAEINKAVIFKKPSEKMIAIIKTQFDKIAKKIEFTKSTTFNSNILLGDVNIFSITIEKDGKTVCSFIIPVLSMYNSFFKKDEKKWHIVTKGGINCTAQLDSVNQLEITIKQV